MSATRPWAVVFGGPSPEHEISILTGLQAERVLTDGGDTVHPIYWAPSGEWFLVPNGTEAKDYLEGAPKSAKPRTGSLFASMSTRNTSTVTINGAAGACCFYRLAHP